MEHIYQHFKKDEQRFIDQVLEWQQRVIDDYRIVTTPFLDPRQQYIVKELIGSHSDVACYSTGGFVNAERQRMVLLPHMYPYTIDDAQISVYTIVYPKKFVQLKHSMILGSLLGTGIKRELVGDIITDGQEWQVCLDKQIGNYLQTQLTKVGSTSVSLTLALESDYLIGVDNYQVQHLQVSSLRLDTIIANVYHISRQKAKDLVELGHVKLNWKEETRVINEVSPKDTISVRKYGRIRFEAVEGQTKKDKYKIIVSVLKNKHSN